MIEPIPRGTGQALLAISDDFTGCVAFAGECRSVGVPAAVQPWSRRIDGDWRGALVVDTQSRLVSTAEAVARIRAAIGAAVRVVGPDGIRIFKRFDSGLRGHVGSELVAVAEETGLPVVIASASPALGVTVQGGEHLLHGIPVHLTEYGSDPAGSLTSSLLDMLPGVVATVSVEQVRSKGLRSVLASAIRAHRFVVIDGEEQNDLALAAAAVASLDQPVALAGTYGFGALAATALSASRTTHPVGALAVVGSMRQASLSQVGRAKSDGAAVVVCTPQSDDMVQLVTSSAAALSAGRDVVLVAHNPDYALTDEWDPTAASRLGELAAWICRQVTPAAVVLVGGETAARTMDATGVVRCRVVLEPWPASAMLIAEGGDIDGVIVITKSGAQGGETWLRDALLIARGGLDYHTAFEPL